MNQPMVSIGMPVYNGENFLQETIDSFLSQTFTDFELIISDNASTDNTESICRFYQAKDERIKYIRNPVNLGAAINYNNTFDLASGKYFKWASHDDFCHPDFLKKCVRLLDEDSSIVLAYTLSNKIDENGKEILAWKDSHLNFSSFSPSERLSNTFKSGAWVLIFGLIRADILSKTPLLGKFPMHDWVLLAELALYGRFQKVPELLFSHRVHSTQFTYSIWKARRERPETVANWFDTQSDEGIKMYYWTRSREHFKSCFQVPLTPKEHILSFIVICRWMVHARHNLGRDILFVLLYSKNRLVNTKITVMAKD